MNYIEVGLRADLNIQHALTRVFELSDTPRYQNCLDRAFGMADIRPINEVIDHVEHVNQTAESPDKQLARHLHSLSKHHVNFAHYEHPDLSVTIQDAEKVVKLVRKFY